jgi:hypothetical protein
MILFAYLQQKNLATLFIAIMSRNVPALLFVFITITFLNPIKGNSQQSRQILQLDFNDKNELVEWQGKSKYKIVKKDGYSVLRINKRNSVLTYSLPMEEVRGGKVEIRIRLKATKVSTPPNSWNGVKVLLHTSVPWGDFWDQLPLETQGFDWKDGIVVATIPLEADSSKLTIGLEEVKGKVWFDRLEINLLDKAENLSKNTIAFNPFIGHPLPRLRGMMVPTFIPDTSLQTLASWGVNHIRWQLTWDGFPYSPADTASLEVYRKWLMSALDHIDSLLPICRENGIRVVIDLHTLPGGRSADYVHNLFRKKENQDAFISVWKEIARRYQNEIIVWGYDLANEPVEGKVPAGLMNWYELATAASNEIRTIDTNHAIIIEGEPSGGLEALTRMQPLPIAKAVYSFHMYAPDVFTHQGIGGRPEGIYYPGKIMGREWNIGLMRKMLQSVKEWQLRYNTHIYVGEFSAIRWAPAQSAYYYLQDCINLFEEMGWDWAYHAFREYEGWSVEPGNSPATTKGDTTEFRQQLLINWFSKNKH